MSAPLHTVIKFNETLLLSKVELVKITQPFQLVEKNY